MSVFDYAERLSLQCERKMKSLFSSCFTGFSPSMPVPLGQLSSVDSVVVTTSTLLAAVCTMTVTLAVVGPAVTTASVTSMPGLLILEHPRKRCRVTDPKERVLMLANFEDWWASRRSTPRPGSSSSLQLPLVTPLVVLVPGPSSALAILAAVAPSFSQSVAFSFRSAKRHHFCDSLGPRPAPAPPPVLDPSAGISPDRSSVRRPSTVAGPVTQPFSVPFPDLSPVQRPSMHMGPVCQLVPVSFPFPDPSPVRRPSPHT